MVLKLERIMRRVTRVMKIAISKPARNTCLSRRWLAFCTVSVEAATSKKSPPPIDMDLILNPGMPLTSAIECSVDFAAASVGAFARGIDPVLIGVDTFEELMTIRVRS